MSYISPMHEAVLQQISKKVSDVVETPIVNLTVAIGGLTATLINELAQMAHGFAEDGMTLDQFADLITGELEKGVTDDNPESGDKSNT